MADLPHYRTGLSGFDAESAPTDASNRRGAKLMSFFHWLSAKNAKVFASELAEFVLTELNHPRANKDAKFMDKAQKTLVKAAIRLQDFKAKNSLNFYQRSVLANQFLWTLRDGGCPESYADQLTEWLTLRL